MKRNIIHQKGQALVTLLFFIIISLTITSAAVIILLSNTLNTSRTQESNLAYYVAEGGIENALMRLLRDPNYTGETLTVGQGSTIITVSGTTTKTIVSDAQIGTFKKKIEVVVDYSNNILTITSWKEIY